MSTKSETLDMNPDVLAARRRVAALQAQAFVLVDEMRERAARHPGDADIETHEQAAQVIYMLALHHAQQPDVAALEAKAIEIERRTADVIASLRAELAEVEKRFADAPERALEVTQTISGIEMAEITRIGAEFQIWLARHAEAVWTEAVQRIRLIPTLAKATA